MDKPTSLTLGWKVLTYLSFTLLLLSSVMNMYAVFGDKYLDIYLVYFAILIYFVLLLSKVPLGRKELSIPKELKVFFIYSFFVTLFTNLTSSGDLIALLTVTIGILGYLVYWKTFESLPFLNYYTVVATVAVFFHFFQNIVKWVTGIGVSGVIPGLTTSKGLAEDAAYNQIYKYDRFSSFFSEPSHLAQFLVPLLIWLLFDNYTNIKRRKVLLLIVCISFILTRSGTSLMLIIPTLLFVLYRIYNNFKGSKLISLLIVTILIIGGIFLGRFFVSSEMGAFVENRSSEVVTASDENGGTSGFVRIWRGYFVYDDYSSFEKIIGNSSHNDILKHVYRSNMELYLEGFALVYFNAIQYLLLHFGIIGFALFMFYIYRLWRGNSYCGKCLLATLIVLMLIEAIYGGARMALFLLMAQSQKNRCSI